MLREAVTQVVRHLVVRAVPVSQRVPLFEQAAGLLDEAGWGLDELVAAAEPGPAQDDLLRALGLEVDAEKDATNAYTEERYTHADGTHTIIREYRADGSYHLMSDRGEIELIDNASDPYAADPVSVVRLP